MSVDGARGRWWPLHLPAAPDRTEFEDDVRLPPRPVVAAMWAAGVAFSLLSVRVGESRQLGIVLLALVAYGLAGVAWPLNRGESLLGRWFVVLASAVLLRLAGSWLGTDVAALLPLPVALAFVMLGLGAAWGAALGQTCLLLWPGFYDTVREAGLALLAVWGVLALAHLSYGTTRRHWEQARRARLEMEQMRDRRGELVRALEDRDHANRQLALANERVTAFRLAAEQAQKAKAAFVANVSHELRAPLNMVIGLVGLIVDRPDIYAEDLPPELWHDLQVVHRNSEHLSSMVKDVLDLSQAEAGRLGIHRQWADLRPVVESALEVVRPLADRKRVVLRAEFAPNLPAVFCDPDRVRQVVLNLVSNAARFTDAGSISVTVEPRGQSVAIAVRDTGPGIAAEDRERVFEPFYQPKGRSGHQGEGSGLGLSISKSFVEQHGGRIWIESEPGSGTTVFVTLPAPGGETPPRWRKLKEDWEWRYLPLGASTASDRDRMRRPRVLVCDESESLLQQLGHSSDDVELEYAEDLEYAGAALEQCPAHALVLNACDSESLLSLLSRAKEHAPGTPIIGCVVPPVDGRALPPGVAGYLAKPVSGTDVERALASVGRPVHRVLLVDDNEDMLYLMTRLLSVIDADLELVYAAGGAQAIAELRRQPVDLVFLDIVMPDVSGWDVLAAMRADGSLGEAPVYLVSAHDLTDVPPGTQFLVAAMDDRIGIDKLMRATLTMSALLLAPD